MTDRKDPPFQFASFQQAVEFLEIAIDYEKRIAWKYTDKTFDLRRMDELLAELGDPHRRLRVIHIAGTKGKGTTAALLEACLRGAGYRTGLHTSPHLVSVCERMIVDGQAIAESEFCRQLADVRGYIDRKRRASRNDAPTYFETTTALAFKYFHEQKVDWAVVEVGLGGRLDSTNVLTPRCCVISPIGFDHMDKLGETLDKIAGEKAGIIKQGVPVVLAKQPYPDALRVLRERADSLGCPRWEVGREVSVARMEALSAPVDDPEAQVGWRFSIRTPERTYAGLFTPLLGAHQVENCATAIAALEVLRERGELEVEPDDVARGIAGCQWPARVELLQRRPALVLDAAHTVESMAALMAALQTHFPGRGLRFVFGCSAGKNHQAMLGLMAPRCQSLIATQADSPRAIPAPEIADAARTAGIGAVRAVADPPEAVRTALREAGPDEVVCVTGSFFVAGEVRHAWEQGKLLN